MKYLNAIKFLFLTPLFLLGLQNISSGQNAGANFLNPPRIVEFLGDQPMTRAGRPFVVLASIANPSSIPAEVTATLNVPEEIRCVEEASRKLSLSPEEKVTLRWTITASKPLYRELVLKLTQNGDILAAGRLPVRF